MLYELLCNGQHPYAASRPVVDEQIIDPTTIRPDIDPSLAAFLRKACAPARAERFATAADMKAQLRGIRDAL
jgi:hypothetical protein